VYDMFLDTMVQVAHVLWFVISRMLLEVWNIISSWRYRIIIIV